MSFIEKNDNNEPPSVEIAVENLGFYLSPQILGPKKVKAKKWSKILKNEMT